MKLLWEFVCVCVFGIFMFISCMWIFHDLEFSFLFYFFLRGFGMSSNLWYKYRLLVLGSITYTLKPFSSEDSCLRVISSSWETWKTRPGLWEQLTVLKRSHRFSSAHSLSHVCHTTCLRRFLWFHRRWPLPPPIAIFPVPLRKSQNTQQLPLMIHFCVRFSNVKL